MQIRHRNTTIELSRGDIAAQPDLDAVVNAANAELVSGGGVAGALHRAAGPGLAEESRPMGPISPGDAVLTSAHNLPNRHVIHALGPVYGRDEPAAELLASAYRNSLRVADERGIRSIGFPAISTGAFGFPIEEATEIALRTCLDTIPELNSIRLIRFVLFGQRDHDVHTSTLTRLASDLAANES
jgi:O-acetyl-ADP-ribose deacetylase